METFIFPKSAHFRVGGISAHTARWACDKAQYTECLQVTRQRRRRASGKGYPVSRHIHPPVLLSPMPANPQYAPMPPATRAGKGHTGKANCAFAQSNSRRFLDAPPNSITDSASGPPAQVSPPPKSTDGISSPSHKPRTKRGLSSPIAGGSTGSGTQIKAHLTVMGGNQVCDQISLPFPACLCEKRECRRQFVP